MVAFAQLGSRPAKICENMTLLQGHATNVCTFLPGMMVGTFACGNERLYRMLNNNPAVRLFRDTFTNDPRTVALNDNFVIINSAVNVDLTGQICAESIGSRQYSGSGGQFDMSYGAVHARGGRCQFICCLHWMR